MENTAPVCKRYMIRPIFALNRSSYYLKKNISSEESALDLSAIDAERFDHNRY
jgi:hypothetical protein